MKFVSSVEIILDLIKRVKQQKKGYLTNFFLDIPKIELWISLKLFDYEVIGETVFLWRKNQGFNNLFFITTDVNALSRDIDLLQNQYFKNTLIIDVIGQLNFVSELSGVLAGKGLYPYTSLVRMSKVDNNRHLDEIKSNLISYADYNKGGEVHTLLQKYFDPYAEQLPLIEEIDKWTKDNKIFIYSDDSHTIQGFLIFELTGQTSYLRYWFVHPDHREKKIGSTLFRSFFTESRNTKRLLFWVIESNENAIKRYEHYGFRKEELFDYVMTNKNICYEG